MNNTTGSPIVTRGKPRLTWARIRNVGAVFAGLVLVVGLMIGSNLLLIRFITATSLLFLALTLAGALVFHLAGGYLCATIAHDASHAILGLIVLGSALMAMSVVQTWAEMPRWYSLAMFTIAPAGLWLGGRAHNTP